MGGRRRRGIVLVTTLVSLVLVIMIVTAVVNINIGSARLGSRFHERETALMAAHSGLEYALTRLQEDLTWRGAPRGADSAWKLILDGPQVRVYEGNGNVVGFLGRGSDRPSFFRIKFNYEDGSGGLDYLEDSAQEQFISSPYVSVNNLYRSKVLAVYPANAEGVLEVERYKDRYGTERLRVSQAEASHFLPPFTCNLIVEGLAGTALRDCQDPSDLANLNLTSSYQRPSWAVGPLASRKVEVYLRAQTFPDPGSQKLAWELYDDWKGRQKLLGHYETAALTLPDNHILQEGQKTYSGLNYEQVTALQSILNNPKGRYSDIKKLSRYYYGEDNYRFQERVRQGEEPTITLDNLEEVQRYLSPALASESFRERKSQQLEELLGKYESLKYTDQDLAGVVYAWGNITVGAGRGSNLHLRGALVAYGGDPQHRPQVDGEMNKGSMRLRAQHIELMMDGDYLQQLLDPQSPDRRLQRTMYAVY